VPSFSWSLQEDDVINSEKRNFPSFSSTATFTRHPSQRSFASSSPVSSSSESGIRGGNARPDKHIPVTSVDHHNRDNDASKVASVGIEVINTASASSFRYNNVMSNRGILFIPNARTSDSGVYICTTNNSLGEDKRSFRISITGEDLLPHFLYIQLIPFSLLSSCIIKCDLKYPVVEFPSLHPSHRINVDIKVSRGQQYRGKQESRPDKSLDV
jgi:hypothetical protein